MTSKLSIRKYSKRYGPIMIAAVVSIYLISVLLERSHDPVIKGEAKQGRVEPKLDKGPKKSLNSGNSSTTPSEIFSEIIASTAGQSWEFTQQIDPIPLDDSKIDGLGLSSKDKSLLSRLNHQYAQKFADAFARSEIHSSINPDTNNQVFVVMPDQAQGKLLKAQFHADLIKLFGEAIADRVVRALPPTSCFGGYCHYRVEIEVFSDKEVIKSTVIDPASNIILSQSTGNPRNFVSHLGRGFLARIAGF